MEIENEFHQKICKDKYHNYIELASKLPEEMRKRGVFEIEDFLNCPKDRLSVEKGVSGFSSKGIIFSDHGTIYEKYKGITKDRNIPISSVEKVIQEFFFISPKNLTEVPQIYMSELEGCISRVYNKLHEFDFYLPPQTSF